MKQRHKSRIAALEIIYSLDIKEELDQLSKDELEDIGSNLEQKLTPFTEELLLFTIKNLAQIDEIINKTSTKWTVERMSVIDRNIIRLGVAELMQGEPAPVIINEAIILAKDFGAENSQAFINGILDNAKNHIPGAKETSK
jgi:N utilization substance protein B